MTNALLGTGIGVGVITFTIGMLLGLTVRRSPDVARERLAELAHAELRRLRHQRRDALAVCDDGQRGKFGMFGLVPVTEIRKALGVPPPTPPPEFGRDNTTPDDPSTGVTGS